MSRIELPRGPGSYRWYYLDANAGDVTVVAIFMIGSLFSARYARAHRRGAEPTRHAAVNFAVYRGGKRLLWVLSEYDGVSVSDDGLSLRIGASTWRYTPHGAVVVSIVDSSALWGDPVGAEVLLEPLGPGHDAVRLVAHADHFWHPFAPHSRATVHIPQLDVQADMHAYHDGNFGSSPLGSDMQGWNWERTRDAERTTVQYRPWRSSTAVSLVATSSSATLRREEAHEPASSLTAWGLTVPQALSVAARPALLESSPFYARLEARSGGAHALAEVAHFQRFQSPWVRWMSNFRTRVVSA
ncbi:MAG: carotenoid 1,2-hydratase [Archangium sp.]|nr:carotenoid 1,2-hydratase [Archangium sp.]